MERFSSNGKSGDLSGWYVLHLHGDYAAGVFGCWRTGIRQTWHSAKGSWRLSGHEWRELHKAITAERARQKQEHQARADNARQVAASLWNAARPADPTHPYLLRKGVGAYGARQHRNSLLLPLCDLDGMLHGLQTIRPDGIKRFLAGTPKRGLFCLIGASITHPQGVYLCEGYATGASLHEAYGLPVLVAFDAGNLQPVASAYRERFPHIPLTICADNDRNPASKGYGVGLDKARAACANLPGVGLIVPEFPEGAPLNLSDFNDLTALLRSNAHKEPNV
ncbi:toprim domain-containing protein [Candidatus Thiothrix sp. Deng01]|uniref:Toprim domain-containing protein n=1 Tax=Candidatus Thiothrix phosphatis TaxID=3112415 RepID=A0ABU6CRP1_9GAMM|nr:toprim domain-containing protein [Candidatus Thiothrix sp. Deng01]MEB4589512.1 toprim domain-containing protein [Candidatus Thiothrix sp. Deng01]